MYLINKIFLLSPMSPGFLELHYIGRFATFVVHSRAKHTVSHGKVGDGGHWQKCTKKSAINHQTGGLHEQDAQNAVPHPLLGDTLQKPRNHNIVWQKLKIVQEFFLQHIQFSYVGNPISKTFRRLTNVHTATEREKVQQKPEQEENA